MEARGVNEWALVIKAKHGDTLRRFGANVHWNYMDYNFAELRAKIVSLFKFSPDADLIITYIDNDGDSVTLTNDEELLDAAITQRLNPLRINVQLKSDTSESYHAKSQTTTSSHTSSPQSETVRQITHAVDEVMKSVLEPMRDAFSNLLSDKVLETASPTTGVTDFAEFFSKLGLLNVSQQAFHGPTGESSGTFSGASTELVDLSVTGEPKVSTDPAPVTFDSPKISSPNPQGIQVPVERATVDLNMQPPRTLPAESGNFLLEDLLSYNELGLGNKSGVTIEEISGMAPATRSMPPSVWTATATRSMPPSGRTIAPNFPTTVKSRQSLSRKTFVKPITATPLCPPSYTPPQSEFTMPRTVPQPIYPLPSVFPHPYGRIVTDHDGVSLTRTFHRGVQCDGCGMHPITGPRFKSNVKEDYDLCNYCFSQMGNGSDYTRIERAPYRSPKGFKHLKCPFPAQYESSWRPWTVKTENQDTDGCGRQSNSKLESRFMKDVTVIDGTVMSPRTPFTKIWRMLNNGTVSWPYGTQLLWIGGDQFGNRGSAELVIPPYGCPVEEQIDIAIDFTAPSRAGRYISYWRMASPSGQKFGQRVWVIIQVVEDPQQNSASAPGINLNLPPESSDRGGLGVIDVVESVSNGANSAAELTEPLNADPSTTQQPVLDDVEQAPTLNVVPPMSLPIIDIMDSSSELAADFGNSETEEISKELSLLRELEEMGFVQIDLNKEVLRLNNYDLEQTVDDLCGYSEWAPLLNELQDMGFYDKDLNRKLLVKNGGSIKHAVLDLIAKENDE